jgi:hypothetical protein
MQERSREKMVEMEAGVLALWLPVTVVTAAAISGRRRVEVSSD